MPGRTRYSTCSQDTRVEEALKVDGWCSDGCAVAGGSGGRRRARGWERERDEAEEVAKL